MPVPSCTTGTSHADKQNARVAAGLVTGYNPFWQLLDRSRIGLAGHSYGAAGVSYVAQWDPRVSAVVAWDNLGGPSPKGGSVPGRSGSDIGEQPCPADPAARTTVAITQARARDLSRLRSAADAQPVVARPGGQVRCSHAYSDAGVDTGEIIIRGGSHLDFSYIPLAAFGASLRGADLIDWYTTAWFDKYVKHDPSADDRLLSSRWRSDAAEAKVDPTHDGNAFSFYYPSRLDIHLASGTQWDCEDMRAGCAGMVAADGVAGTYSYLAVDTSKDHVGAGSTIAAPGANSLYREKLPPRQVAALAATLPKNLALAIQTGLLAW